MASFYTDNPDLRRRLEAAPWEELSSAASRDEIAMALETTGRIAAEEIAPYAAEVDRVGARLVDGEVVYPEPTRRAFGLLAEAGLMGLTLPRDYGGMDFPVTAYTGVVEMISRADASLMTLFALQGCGDTIHRFGTDAMCRRFLPGLAGGERTACMALTEPGAGSALDTVTTRAEEQPDGTFLLTGEKCFITNGGADVLLVLARSEDRSGAHGLSLFVVEKGEGVAVAKLESKLGIHGSPTAAVRLDGARGVLLGSRGGGLFPVALSLMYHARLEVAAQAVGIAQAAQVQAARYASERRQRRNTIDSFPPVRTMLFENAVQIEAGRGIVLAAGQVLDRQQALKRAGGPDAEIDRLGQMADLLTPLAKYYASEMATEVASRAIQVHGGYGYMNDFPVERHYRDARITSIYEGTSQIQVGTMIGPLLQGGLAVLFEERLETTHEPRDCAGVLDSLRLGYVGLERTVAQVRRAGKQAWQGWARQFADVAADLLSALIFLEDAAESPRAAKLARYQTRSASRRVTHLIDTVADKDCLAFDDESFEAVVGAYR